MKRLALFACALAVVLGLSAAALASDAKEVTLTGKIACAHCTLKLEGVTSCQDVLVVEKDGKPTYYYVAKNEVAKSFGHVCSGEKKATVTGTLSEKDGKTWIEASEIKPAA
jgi:hypothetical protein